MSDRDPKFKDFLRKTIDDCFDAVHESKIGPLRCEDKAHLAGLTEAQLAGSCERNQVIHSHAFQTFLTMVASVAPKYFFNELRQVEPREPWQGDPEEDDPDGQHPETD